MHQGNVNVREVLFAFLTDEDLEWSDLPDYMFRHLPCKDVDVGIATFEFIFDSVACGATESEALQVMKDVVNYFGLNADHFTKAEYKPKQYIVRRLIEHGQLDILKLLRELVPCHLPHTNEMRLAAKMGHVNIVKWIYSLPNVHRVVDDDHCILNRYLRYVRKRNDYELFLFCVHVWSEIVQYRAEYPTYKEKLNRVAHTAFKRNQTKIMDWFKENCIEIAATYMIQADTNEKKTLERQLIEDLDSRKIRLEEVTDLTEVERVLQLLEANKGNELAFKLLISYIYTNMME